MNANRYHIEAIYHHIKALQYYSLALTEHDPKHYEEARYHEQKSARAIQRSRIWDMTYDLSQKLTSQLGGTPNDN